MNDYVFSKNLQEKIDYLNQKKIPIQIGRVQFNSRLILAPLASITDVPYRLLMQDLGAGGCVSELISCHGINYQNDKTLKMLKIDEIEKTVGLQLFGEDPQQMAKAATVCEEMKPHFIDINVGCPVKKVVAKGAGSALLKNLDLLEKIIQEVRKTITLPLSLKIRTGWSKNEFVAHEIVDIAYQEKIEFITLHGRSRDQLYHGHANWDYIEEVARTSKLPILGNGDLHHKIFIREKMKHSACRAFMLGRGPLRNPFLFLESYSDDNVFFSPQDHLEVLKKLYSYMIKYYDRDKSIEIQLKRHAQWISAGYPGASGFRKKLFTLHGHDVLFSYICDYFNHLEETTPKNINLDLPFLAGGHG